MSLNLAQQPLNPKPYTLPESQKYVEYWSFWLYLGLLSHYFTYLWGPGKHSATQHSPAVDKNHGSETLGTKCST